MLEQPEILAQQRFIQICLDMRLLDEPDAKSLSTLISDRSNVAQSAVQRGMLTPADVDVVHSLLHPMEVVPGYKILDLIGRGGMGVVYRAEQLDLEKIVALKTILISNVSDSIVTARFEREAKSLARLQHPNIVQALNFGRHEGRYFFSMEYVPGRTCEQAVSSRGLIPSAEVWSIVRQVASGLMHALRQNLLHRDIKPANLILLPPPDGSADDAEVVKIADFGLAMFADQGPEQLKLTTGDKIMGSPAYMSLEQFGGRSVDFRSDMYSLGATAWHLLFGRPPFEGNGVAALFRQKAKPLWVDPADLPIALPEPQMKLLYSLMSPDPDQRPQDYRQLIDAIDDFGIDGPSKPVHSGHSNDHSDAYAISEQATVDILSLGMRDSSESIDDEMPRTVEMDNQLAPRQSSRRRWVGVLSVFAVLLLLAGYSMGSTKPRGQRTHTRLAGNTPLFDGVTLSGWDVGGSMTGAWNTVEAPDSSTAIACTTSSGALTRRFPEVPFPRVSLFVWLQSGGGTIDIDFALDPVERSDVRGCLRLTEDSVQLGEKNSDFGKLDVTVTAEGLPEVLDRFQVVHIERQPTDWFVFLEEKFIGTLPIASIGNSNAIRLVVQGSDENQEVKTRAYFADVQLSDLRSAEAKAE
jgi:serine/threonine-protein kinase